MKVYNTEELQSFLTEAEKKHGRLSPKRRAFIVTSVEKILQRVGDRGVPHEMVVQLGYSPEFPEMVLTEFFIYLLSGAPIDDTEALESLRLVQEVMAAHAMVDFHAAALSVITSGWFAYDYLQCISDQLEGKGRMPKKPLTRQQLLDAVLERRAQVGPMTVPDLSKKDTKEGSSPVDIDFNDSHHKRCASSGGHTCRCSDKKGTCAAGKAAGDASYTADELREMLDACVAHMSPDDAVGFLHYALQEPGKPWDGKVSSLSDEFVRHVLCQFDEESCGPCPSPCPSYKICRAVVQLSSGSPTKMTN